MSSFARVRPAQRAPGQRVSTQGLNSLTGPSSPVTAALLGIPPSPDQNSSLLPQRPVSPFNLSSPPPSRPSSPLVPSAQLVPARPSSPLVPSASLVPARPSSPLVHTHPSSPLVPFRPASPLVPSRSSSAFASSRPAPRSSSPSLLPLQFQPQRGLVGRDHQSLADGEDHVIRWLGPSQPSSFSFQSQPKSTAVAHNHPAVADDDDVVQWPRLQLPSRRSTPALRVPRDPGVYEHHLLADGDRLSIQQPRRSLSFPILEEEDEPAAENHVPNTESRIPHIRQAGETTETIERTSEQVPALHGTRPMSVPPLNLNHLISPIASRSQRFATPKRSPLSLSDHETLRYPIPDVSQYLLHQFSRSTNSNSVRSPSPSRVDGAGSQQLDHTSALLGLAAVVAPPSSISHQNTLRSQLDASPRALICDQVSPPPFRELDRSTHPIIPFSPSAGPPRLDNPEQQHNFAPAIVNPISDIARTLSRSCYAEFPSQHYNVGDEKTTVNYFINLLDNKLLPDEGDLYRRARRVAVKLSMTTKSIPDSFILDPKDVSVEPGFPIKRGGFADVYKGLYRGIRVAYKRLRVPKVDEDFCREAMVWRMLSHQYILPFIGVHLDQTNSFISLVSPWMENGTLREWRNTCCPSPAEIQRSVLSVAKGLAYIHGQGFVHGDIRGSNVLIDDHLEVKISDLGLACHPSGTGTNNPPMSGHFAAPELFGGTDDDDESQEGVQRTPQMDVYAFACLYYEIQFDQLPFARLGYGQIALKVVSGIRPQRLPTPPLGDGAWDLIELCWRQAPIERPTMDEVVGTLTRL